MTSLGITEDSKLSVCRDTNLLWKLWDDEFVIYNSSSGDTHLLDWHTGQILKKIQFSPQTATELSRFFSNELQVELTTKLTAGIQERLLKLIDLNIIEPVP